MVHYTVHCTLLDRTIKRRQESLPIYLSRSAKYELLAWGITCLSVSIRISADGLYTDVTLFYVEVVNAFNQKFNATSRNLQ
jgi:hypothetical protein